MTKEEALRQAKTNTKFLHYFTEWNNDVVMIAVQEDRLSLQYASKELRKDKNIILFALKKQ